MEIAIIVFAALVIVAVIVTACYVKASPDTAYIISGLRKNPRTIIGSGGIKIPLIERLDKLFLGQVNIDVKTSAPVPTNDYIDVTVDAACSVQVDLPLIQVAARNFLNRDSLQISSMIKDNLEGNMREVIGSLSLAKLVTDRDAFSDQIAKKASQDMQERGLRIISCNIQNIVDQNGLIQNLGADNVYKIRQEAAITKANAEKNIAIAQSTAQKEANDVRVKTETEIAERNNELAIKKAELQTVSDTKKAAADAAYAIQQQEQQKTINEKTIDAQIAQTKREQELAEQEVKVMENKLRAEVNAKADAAKYQKQVASDAAKYQTQIDAEAKLEQQKREAEAFAYNAVKEAEAVKAKAEAQLVAEQRRAEAVRVNGLAEAEAIKAKGLAEAEAIKAKGIAEAEAMDKKAEAYAKYGQAAIIEILSKVMPDMAKSVAEPISAIDNLNIYGGDGATAASKLSANVPTVIKQTLDTVKSVTGVDMAEYAKSKITVNNSHSINKTIDDVDFEDTND